MVYCPTLAKTPVDGRIVYANDQLFSQGETEQWLISDCGTLMCESCMRNEIATLWPCWRGFMGPYGMRAVYQSSRGLHQWFLNFKIYMKQLWNLSNSDPTWRNSVSLDFKRYLGICIFLLL